MSTMASKPFRWEIRDEEGQQVVFLSGPLNESAHLDELAARITHPTVFDLEGVDRINSCGVREWILFMEQVCLSGKHALRRCSPPIVEQLNMVCNFKGSTCTVQSVMAPFVCEACDIEQAVEIAITGAEVKLPRFACKQCGQPMEFDEAEPRYFLFTKY
jgi:anti-anti-sigma regulatory factor